MPLRYRAGLPIYMARLSDREARVPIWEDRLPSWEDRVPSWEDGLPNREDEFGASGARRGSYAEIAEIGFIAGVSPRKGVASSLPSA